VIAYGSPKLRAYLVLGAAGLVAAIAFGVPELAALAAPFLAIVAVGLAAFRRPSLAVRAELDRDRVLEGEEVELELRVEVEEPVEHLDLYAAIPPQLRLVGGARNPTSLRLERGAPTTHTLPIDCVRWGGYALGRVGIRVRDPLGLFVFEDVLDLSVPLRVYPRAEQLQRLVDPRETQVFVGDIVSKEKRDGIEFADLRPFGPGDRLNRVNWRASARGKGIWVNEHHPERNADAVLFLDTFADRGAVAERTIVPAVRAAVSLVERYLGRKDRVGLVSFGGTLSWLVPGRGLTQLYRVVDSLLDTQIAGSYARGDISLIPRRILPPKALVIALTPLLDDRVVRALLDLRGRGFDLVVVEISAVQFVEPGGELAYRLWLLRRKAVRMLFLSSGIPIVQWRESDPLSAALEEVSAFRRRGRQPA
jgi:uncharacterized protein (DUF58 family)